MALSPNFASLGLEFWKPWLAALIESNAPTEHVVDVFELALRCCPHEDIAHDMISYIAEQLEEDLLVRILIF